MIINIQHTLLHTLVLHFKSRVHWFYVFQYYHPNSVSKRQAKILQDDIHLNPTIRFTHKQRNTLIMYL